MDKVPPHSKETEQAFIYDMIQSADAVFAGVTKLQPHDFFIPDYKSVFEAIQKLYEDQVPVDLITLSGQLKKDKSKVTINDLAEICEIRVTTANFEHHLAIIKEFSIKRQLIRNSVEILQEVYDQDSLVTLDKTIDGLEVLRGKLHHTTLDSMPIANKAVDRLIALKNKSIIPIQTGLYDLDKYLVGFTGGEFILLAGRPSMGKTAVALSMMKHIVKQGKHVSFISLDMTDTGILNRWVSMFSNIPLKKIRQGEINNDEMEKFIWNIDNNFVNSPITIIDKAEIDIAGLSALVKELREKKKTELIVIDYIQKIVAPRRSNQEEEVSDISKACKMIAKKYDVPVLALAQLNRQAVARADKRPIMSDLRNSGQLEQDADVIMFVHRPEYYGDETCKDGSPSINKAEIIIAKQRDGEQGTVYLYFDKTTTEFKNIERRFDDDVRHFQDVEKESW